MHSLVLLVVWLAAACGAPVGISKPRQPHIVVMVLDDVGWADVSFHNSSFPTPNLDVLAQSGVELKRYYVQPVCSPTRSAILSGRYPHKTGMQHFTTLMPCSTAHLPTKAEGTQTMAEMLKEQGYSTHAIGKWHLGYSSWDFTPTGRGFDSHMGYFQGAIDYYTHEADSSILSKKGPKIGGLDFWSNRKALQGTNGTYSMDYYENASTHILDNYNTSDPDAKPLFIYYAHEEIHEPLQVPPASRGSAGACKDVTATPNRNTLCQMMSVLDSAVGNFVDQLKAKGIWDDTVLWVTTDNGGMTAFQDGGVGSASSNYPLRAGKTTLFEGGVRGVSFVTGGENVFPAKARGTSTATLMHAVDIVASLVPLAQSGSASPTDLSAVDGIDLWGTITGRESSRGRTELPINVLPHCKVCGTLNGQHHLPLFPQYSAMISGDWKIIQGSATVTYDGWWTNGDYKWIHANKSDTEAVTHLYNITADPGEHHNVADSEPEVVATLLKRLEFYADPANGFKKPQSNLPHPKGMPQLNPALKGSLAPFM